MINSFNRVKGVLGETAAVNFLIKKGFSVLERNYSPKTNFQGGEIDIIAKCGERIHFIEVKMRTSDGYGYGREAVNFAKQKTIRKIAARYLAERDMFYTAACSFDVIEITGNSAGFAIEFLENCF